MSSNKLARGAWLGVAVAAGLGLALAGLQAVAAQAADATPAAPGGSPVLWFVDNSPGEGLVGYWKFDEISGTRTLNSAVLTTTTTLANGASLTETIPLTLTVPNFDALLLDGVNDDAVVSDTAALNVAPTAFSLAVWARRTAGNTYDAIYDSGSQTNKWWVFIADNTKGNKFGFGQRGVVEVYSNKAIFDLDWHHLAVVKTNQATNNLTFYVDGAPEGVVTVTNVLTPSGDKRIGALLDVGQQAQFGGFLDDLRLYNRALSAAEVDRLADGRGCTATGASWATAFDDLQCALDMASAGDDIWVAGGTYRPGTNRLGGYPLVDGVDVLGGFAGTEVGPSQRPAFDPASPLTTLSGDAAGNNTPFISGDQDDDQCGVLLAGSLLFPSSVNLALDSLAIRDGSAGCDGDITVHSGGGLHQTAGGTLTLSRLLFRDNRAVTLGGGVLASGGGAISLDAVTFISNTAALGGALGMNAGHITITASSFVSNSASQGGAIALRPALGNASLSVATTSFSHNWARRGGALDSDMGPGQLDLLFDRVTFASNQATLLDGGAVHSALTLPGVVLETYRQTDFIGNYALEDGGAIASEATALTMTDSTFTANVSQSAAGGALLAQGAVSIARTTFLSNTAYTTAGALGVIGSLDLSDSSLTQNSVSGFGLDFIIVPAGGGALVSGTATITHTLFQSNTASLVGSVDHWAGGGGLATLGSLSVSRSEFRGNIARLGGGLQAKGSAVITETLFQSNAAGEGGAVAADGGLALFRSRLIDNTAQQSLFTFQTSRGGGVFLQNGGLAGQVVGNLFVGNRAKFTDSGTPSGDALYLDSQATLVGDNTIVGRVVTGTAVSVTGSVTVLNNILTNHAVAIEHRGGTTVEDNNVFFGNLALSLGAVTSGGHSHTADPLFVNPALDDYHLRPGSPALDAGDNTKVPAGLTKDLDGNPRFLDNNAPDTGAGPTPIVDIGAYEANNHIYLPVLMR